MPKMMRIHHQAMPTYAVGVPFVTVLQRETPPGPKPKLSAPVLLRLLGQSHDATSHSCSCHDSPGASGGGGGAGGAALPALADHVPSAFQPAEPLLLADVKLASKRGTRRPRSSALALKSTAGLPVSTCPAKAVEFVSGAALLCLQKRSDIVQPSSSKIPAVPLLCGSHGSVRVLRPLTKRTA